MSQRVIPDPGFADDDGAPDPVLRAALAAHRAGDAGPVEVLAALASARLLVPVVAVVGETTTGSHGLLQEKSSDMAAVLLTGADGRTALLAFTGADSLAAWDPAARPVPVTTTTAALAAVQEGAAAVVVDVAGPASYVVAGTHLRPLAAGWRPARVDGALVWLGRAPGPADSSPPG